MYICTSTSTSCTYAHLHESTESNSFVNGIQALAGLENTKKGDSLRSTSSRTPTSSNTHKGDSFRSVTLSGILDGARSRSQTQSGEMWNALSGMDWDVDDFNPSPMDMGRGQSASAVNAENDMRVQLLSANTRQLPEGSMAGTLPGYMPHHMPRSQPASQNSGVPKPMSNPLLEDFGAPKPILNPLLEAARNPEPHSTARQGAGASAMKVDGSTLSQPD